MFWSLRGKLVLETTFWANYESIWTNFTDQKVMLGKKFLSKKMPKKSQKLYFLSNDPLGDFNINTEKLVKKA